MWETNKDEELIYVSHKNRKTVRLSFLFFFFFFFSTAQ